VLIGIGVAVVVAAIALVVALAGGDDDDPATSSTTTTRAEISSTTTGSAAPTAGTPASPADIARSIYPNLAEAARFDDPVQLATAFATGILGFDTDVDVRFRETGEGTGSVELRPSRTADPTTLDLAQLADGSWIVLEASSESIQLTSPTADAQLTSPQALAGSAYAFEGHVDVSLYADGIDAPIGNTFVIGRGDGTLGRFQGQLRFVPPDDATYGVLVLSSPNGDDGTSTAAAAIRVRF
jgi:hypothetical protein